MRSAIYMLLIGAAIVGTARTVAGARSLQTVESLTVTVVESASGDTLPARCSITDANGVPRYPLPLPVYLYHTYNGGYFYAGTTFTVDVPAGPTVVRFGHGPEYTALVDTIPVAGDTSVVCTLSRIVDMAEGGWYAGDTHVHINHAGGYYTLLPADAWRIGRAEELDVINCLDNDYHFTGSPDPVSTTDCIVFMAEENRSNTYGHMGLIGINSLVYPFSSAWWPMTFDVAQSAKAASGVVVSAHPVTTDDFSQVIVWPGSGLARELPVDMVEGVIDGFEVLCYSNAGTGGIELDLWYRLLNCGFELTACGGTDSAVNRYTDAPPGGCRTYVRIPDGDFSYDSWLSNLAAGQTFVTNAPLITQFDIEGFVPGDRVEFGSSYGAFTGNLSVRCAYPFERAEIVQNGEVAVTIELEPARCELDTTFSVYVTESCWITARVSGANTWWYPQGEVLFAHTSPVYFNLGGAVVVKEADAGFFVQWIADLESLVVDLGSFPSPAESIQVLSQFSAARHYYEALAQTASVDADDADDCLSRFFIARNEPNPFSTGTVIHFGAAPRLRTAPDQAELVVFDVQGRVVRRLYRGVLAGSERSVYWDGRDERGMPAVSGVYFCVLRVGSRRISRKIVLIR